MRFAPGPKLHTPQPRLVVLMPDTPETNTPETNAPETENQNTATAPTAQKAGRLARVHQTTYKSPAAPTAAAASMYGNQGLLKMEGRSTGPKRSCWRPLVLEKKSTITYAISQLECACVNTRVKCVHACA